MRGDLKDVGRIKKERRQSLYGPFLEIVMKYYNEHLKLIKDMPCEGTMPMFLNRNKDRAAGVYRAMTTDSYRKRIQRLYRNHVLPACQDHEKPELADYFIQMQGRTWGAHAFRHWFTVALILNGVDDIVQIMDLRGDSNPSSARTYLANKGVLMEKYRKAAEQLGMMING